MNTNSDQELRAWVTAELKLVLATLAAPFEQQVVVVPRGTCLACELAGDVQNFGPAFLGQAHDLAEGQRRGLDELLAWLGALEASAEYRCWDEATVRDAAGWEHARGLARRALRELNL